MGFVIQRHFCQNELKSVSVFVKAESCHEKAAEKAPCPMHSSNKHSNSFEKEGCCNDEIELVKLDQDFQIESFQIELQNNPILLGLISLALRVELSGEEISNIHFLNYRPPLLVCDFTVSLQTFLC